MMTTEIAPALAERALAGEVLTTAELQELDTADVLALGMLADDVRRARVGDTVTFSRVLEATADALAADAWDQLTSTADVVRLTTLPATLADAVALVGQVAARVPAGGRLAGFSLADINMRGWGGLTDVLAALRQAGLDAVAEAPIDLVSPGDVEAVRDAGLGLDVLSVQRPSTAARVTTVERIRLFLDAHPTLAVAPLSREQSVTTPTTGYHDVRLVALVRIGVPMARRIEVDWQQYGPKLAQVALTYGANHLDRVSLVDDPALGRRRTTLEDVRRNIVAAGYTPVEGAPAQ